MNRRVAITGIGIVSTLGTDSTSVAEALYAGRSGIGVDEERTSLGFLSPLAGIIPPFTGTAALTRKQRKSLPEFAEWAVEAVTQAIAGSGLAPEDLRNEQTGIIFGCDSSCLGALEPVQTLLEKKATTSLGSGFVFRSMNSCISMNLNTLLGTQGACWTISAACASGGHAVGQAADLIALGKQDRIICGGAQEITWQSMCSFDGLGAFSTRIDRPQAACRPFDAARDGLVPSGGAAALMLEAYDQAEQRGATILGEVVGYGFSSDGENLSVPSKSGLGRAMRQALRASRVAAGDITYICAHATSTPVGDGREAANIADVFGERSVPVSSTKSMTGHELWMSGASQAVYCALMAQNGFIAPNINFSEPDADTARLNIVSTPLEHPPGLTLCNSAGFGGTNSSLILRF